MHQQRRPARRSPPDQQRGAVRRSRRRSSCLWNVVLIGVLALLLLEGYVHLARPSISSFLGEQVAVRLGLPATPAGTGQPGGTLEEQITGQARQSLPTAIAALPSGELRVTDAQANAYLAANMEALDPIEEVRVQFVPGQVQAEVRVFGTVSQITAGLAVQEGRATLIDPQIDGPLGTLVSIEEIVRPLEREINTLLLNQGQRLEAGRIEQGEVIVYIAQG